MIKPQHNQYKFTSQVILKEIDEEFTEDELDEIIAEVSHLQWNKIFLSKIV